MTHDPQVLEADIRDRLRPFVGRDLSPGVCDQIRAACLERLRHVPAPIQSPAFRVSAHPHRDGAVIVTARGFPPWAV